jgi:hypothetical protein
MTSEDLPALLADGDSLPGENNEAVKMLQRVLAWGERPRRAGGGDQEGAAPVGAAAAAVTRATAADTGAAAAGAAHPASVTAASAVGVGAAAAAVRCAPKISVCTFAEAQQRLRPRCLPLPHTLLPRLPMSLPVPAPGLPLLWKL